MSPPTELQKMSPGGKVMNMPASWSLPPGAQIVRKDLHDEFGGRRQGGIGPSAQSPNVFVFSDPVTGAKHGYIDDWRDDGHYHYTGEGQFGDQKMTQGNAAVLNHASEGRAIRLFRGVGGLVTYVGRFEVGDPAAYETDAPETGGESIRTVIVFRLRPLDSEPPSTAATGLSPVPVVDLVPIEGNFAEKFAVNPSAELRTAERVEAGLVAAFAEALEQKGLTAQRQKIYPPGEIKPLFTDLVIHSCSVLVEAKGSTTRESVRMAIGQLADYGRFVGVHEHAVLLPSKPRDDLLHLLKLQNISVIWKSGATFVGEGKGAKLLGMG